MNQTVTITPDVKRAVTLIQLRKKNCTTKRIDDYIALLISRFDPAHIFRQVPWSTSGANDNGLIRLRNDHDIGDPLKLETTQAYNKVGVKRFNLRHQDRKGDV